jgi:hypothetical protein
MADEADGKGSTGEFEQQAQRAAKASTGPVAEFRYFLGRTRKYWLVPVIVALLVASMVVVVGGSAVAPLIYALF